MYLVLLTVPPERQCQTFGRVLAGNSFCVVVKVEDLQTGENIPFVIERVDRGQ